MTHDASVDRLKGYVDSGRLEQVLVVSEPDEQSATTRIPVARNRRAG